MATEASEGGVDTMDGLEAFVGKLEQQARLAHARIADDDIFEKVLPEQRGITKPNVQQKGPVARVGNKIETALSVSQKVGAERGASSHRVRHPNPMLRQTRG